jgi:hypothetical protein
LDRHLELVLYTSTFTVVLRTTKHKNHYQPPEANLTKSNKGTNTILSHMLDILYY